MKIQKPTVGRIVEVALLDTERSATVRRPAIVVSTDMGGSDGINVQLFLDGRNDAGVQIDGRLGEAQGVAWLTSVHHNGDGHVPTGHRASWRYPPRVDTEIDVQS